MRCRPTGRAHAADAAAVERPPSASTSRRHRVIRRLAVFWVAATAVLLLGIAGHVVTERGFPLGLGLIQTKGLAGLWPTLLPGVLGIAGVVLLGRSSRAAGALLLAYSAFWALVLASLLPTAGHGSRVGLPVVVMLLTPFVLVGAWSCGILAGGRKAGP